MSWPSPSSCFLGKWCPHPAPQAVQSSACASQGGPAGSGGHTCRGWAQRGPWRAGLGRGLLTKAWQVEYPKGGVVPGLVMGAGSTPQAWGACQGVGSGSGDGGYPGSRSQLFGTLQEGARAGLPGGVSVNKHAVGVQRAAQGAAPPSCPPTPPPGLGMCGLRCLGRLGVKWLQPHLGRDLKTACLASPSPPRAFSSMTPPSLRTPIFALCSLPTPQTLYPWRHSCLLGYL